MNELAKQELDKVKWVVLPPYDSTTKELYIDAVGAPTRDLLEGHFYILKIADHILNPSEHFTLASSWNKGIIPQSQYIRCQLLRKLGKMYMFGAIGFDMENGADKDDIYPELWLPYDGITVIKILE